MRKVLREKSIMTANFENAICETFMFTMPCFTQAILKFNMNISHVASSNFYTIANTTKSFSFKVSLVRIWYSECVINDNA